MIIIILTSITPKYIEPFSHLVSSSFLAGLSYVFIDQSYWMNTIAAKPAQGIWGFICAAFCIFIIPVALGTALGTALLVLQFKTGGFSVSEEEEREFAVYYF